MAMSLSLVDNAPFCERESQCGCSTDKSVVDIVAYHNMQISAICIGLKVFPIIFFNEFGNGTRILRTEEISDNQSIKWFCECTK